MKTILYEASPNQLRYWKHFRSFPNSPALNMTVALYFDGLLRKEELLTAAISVVNRHEAFLGQALEISGNLYWESSDRPPFSREDTQIVQFPEIPDALRELREEATLPFDLDTDLPLRLKIIEINDRRNILVMTIHSIVMDGHSMDWLTDEIFKIYDAISDDSLLPSILSQKVTADSQKYYAGTPAGIEDAAYWEKTLANAPVGSGFTPDLPARNPSEFPPGKVTWAYMPEVLAGALQIATSVAGVTPYVFFLAAYAKLLMDHENEKDIIIGVPYLSRLGVEDANPVGFVGNTLPLRFKGEASESEEFIKETANICRQGFMHQHLPYTEILKKIGSELESYENSLFRSMFILQSSQSVHSSFKDLDCKQACVSTGGTKYDQTWKIEECKGIYTLDVEWNSELYSDIMIGELMEDYLSILAGFVAAHNLPSCGTFDWDRSTFPGWTRPKQEDLSQIFSGPVVL